MIVSKKRSKVLGENSARVPLGPAQTSQ